MRRAFLLVVALALVACAAGGEEAGGRRAVTTTTAPAITPAPVILPPSTSPPATSPPSEVPPATTRVTEAPRPVDPIAGGLAPYGGLGAWFDAFDWSVTFSNGAPTVGLGDVEHMAALGVQTLYIQTSRFDAPTDVLEPERLLAIIETAHAVGLRVVAWYLPTFEDPATDLARLLAAAALPVDGVAVDIESRALDDVALRSRRVVELSQALRAALPGRAIGGIVLPPVVMEDVNPAFWPGFPWAEIGPLYDVWLPMSYWTNRTLASGWRDGYRYTAVNIDRVRARTGRADAPVHTIGGIGDATSEADVAGMLAASAERGCIGGSLYDYRTTGDTLWAALVPFRR